MDLARLATRHLFFTGKGGVGKTSVACATAVKLADMGKRVLLVSTDPASNLDEVLGSALRTTPTPVAGVPGLFALNLDPEAAARSYRDRVVGPYRDLLPPTAVASMEEQLSGACTVEIAAFDEFAKLLGDVSATAEFDCVLFDTAPTGHTLRLLTLPSAWTGFVQQSAFGTSCLGPLAGLEKQRNLYEATVKALGDPAATTMVLVSRPETSALAEAARTSSELAALGVRNQRLVLNAVFEAEGDDPIALALARRGREAIAAMPALLRDLPRTTLPLRPAALVGIDALRWFDAPVSMDGGTREDGASPNLPSLGTLIDGLAATPCGVVLTMGKGGVGKTTVAAAIAVALARRGLRVRLSTTDPAAHVADAVGSPPPGLTVSRIDPAAETRAYRDEVLATVGAQLDEKGRALLEEDLRSPCTEEVAVFRAFARTVAEGADAFVVLDTAPTGHTILLLDAAESYHREVLRQGSRMPESVRGLLPRLRDPAFTRVLLVTLPEATPVHEAQALQGDLARADIAPFAWVVNQSLAPVATRDPVLAARRRAERPFLDEVRALSRNWAVVPWAAEPPRGEERLALLSTERTRQELLPEAHR
ncbi:MAG: arsenical pump-driving ATPase [Anaeromyxobacter sp. RBG_16_69_14]|nr:MAG: arsenical pump-driving ATPase [Anaeromyxobacter sp. RBG_16_69_14]